MSVIGLALLIAAFTVVSRVLTTFTRLYLMKQGLRASPPPAINLAQISVSVLVIQTGACRGSYQRPENVQRCLFCVRGWRCSDLCYGA